jgi:hypothetical protein
VSEADPTLVDRRPPPCASHAREAATTTCHGCGLFLCAGCAAPEPRCARCRGAGHPVPWEDPSLGVAPAFGRTLKALSTGATFFNQVPWSGGLRAPLTFTALATTLTAVVTGAFTIVSAKLAGGSLAGLHEQLRGAAPDAQMRQTFDLIFQAVERLQGMQVRFALLDMAWSPVLAPLQLLIMGALTHGLARALGGRGSFEATVRAMGYASGAVVLGVVPMIGAPLSTLAVLILTGMALRRAHGVTPMRAAALTLWWIPVMAVFACLFLGLFASRVAPILLGR